MFHQPVAREARDDAPTDQRQQDGGHAQSETLRKALAEKAWRFILTEYRSRFMLMAASGRCIMLVADDHLVLRHGRGNGHDFVVMQKVGEREKGEKGGYRHVADVLAGDHFAPDRHPQHNREQHIEHERCPWVGNEGACQTTYHPKRDQHGQPRAAERKTAGPVRHGG